MSKKEEKIKDKLSKEFKKRAKDFQVKIEDEPSSKSGKRKPTTFVSISFTVIKDPKFNLHQKVQDYAVDKFSKYGTPRIKKPHRP